MIPIFVLNNHDYTAYVEDVQTTVNDMDAEGSGRDVTTGTMYRNVVTRKDSLSVSFLPLPDAVMQILMTDLNQPFVEIIFLHPLSGLKTSNYYCATRPCGSQRYNRGAGYTEYTGVTLSFTEQ